MSADLAASCPPGNGSTLIYRQMSFTLAAFDHLKEYQRHLELTEGRRLTNSEALGRLILSHSSA